MNYMEFSRLVVQTSIPQKIFNIISSKLQSDAIEKNITHETFAQFSERIITTITSYSVREIDKIIESMHKGMKMIVKNKGERLKYSNLYLQGIHLTAICR